MIQLLALALILAGSPAWGQGEQAADGRQDLELCPPPAEMNDEQTVGWILVEQLGTWQRTELVTVMIPGEVSAMSQRDLELLSTFGAVCGAMARYANTEGPGTAEVLEVTFASWLDALGFFSAQQTEDAERVLLTSAAFRAGGALHVHSGRHYLRVTTHDTPRQALPADQYLGARLEVRLPQRPDLPRLLAIFPQSWLSAVTVRYGPSEVLTEEPRPMTLSVTHTLGRARIVVHALQAESERDAREYYTRLLQQAMKSGRAFNITDLGEEAFAAENTDRVTMAIRQDQFVAYIADGTNREDAEAVLRLLGIAVRTSEPLPEVEVDPNYTLPPTIPFFYSRQPEEPVNAP